MSQSTILGHYGMINAYLRFRKFALRVDADDKMIEFSMN